MDRERTSRSPYNTASVNAVKHLLRWFGKGIAENVRKYAIEDLFASLTAIFAAIKGRSWLAGQAVCMANGSCTISGPRLTLLVLSVYLLVAAGIVLAVLLWRSRTTVTQLQAQLRPLPFEAVRVEDQRYHLYWLMKRPPVEWRDVAAPYQVAPEWLAGVIGGPFHAEGCNGRLDEDWSTPGKGAFVKPECPACGLELWRPRREAFETMPKRIKQLDMRWQVLQELQRMSRGGDALTGPVVLHTAQYWKMMTPIARGPAPA
jgi:hypothetical protein